MNASKTVTVAMVASKEATQYKMDGHEQVNLKMLVLEWIDEIGPTFWASGYPGASGRFSDLGRPGRPEAEFPISGRRLWGGQSSRRFLN